MRALLDAAPHVAQIVNLKLELLPLNEILFQYRSKRCYHHEQRKIIAVLVAAYWGAVNIPSDDHISIHFFTDGIDVRVLKRI